MSEKTEGLLPKYGVHRNNDPDGKHDDCRFFVLDPRHDPLAGPTLFEYADRARVAGYEALATDLLNWLADLAVEREARSTPTACVREAAKRMRHTLPLMELNDFQKDLDRVITWVLADDPRPQVEFAESTQDDGRMVAVPAWALEDYERNSVVLATRDRFYAPRHRAAFEAIHASQPHFVVEQQHDAP